MAWFYYLGMTFVLRPMFFLLTCYRVNGRGNVPKQGPLIVVANHLSNFDPPLLSTSLPCRIVFMAKEELFRHPILGPLTKGWQAFPVNRDKIDREALRQADQVVRQGLALGLFPEGTRSPSAKLQQGYTGAALIALRSGCPILPVGIAGTENFNKLDFVFHRPKITVNIGKPFTLPAHGGRMTKEQLAPATDIMMKKIAELLPESYRGYYAD
jgi:1-acyl-sn-glycerol-3-phosphate acyltransferase